MRAGGSPVADWRMDQVCEEEEVHENALGDDNRHPENLARLPELEEGQQMHSLILRFLQQRVDPAVVPILCEWYSVSGMGGYRRRECVVPCV